MHDQTNWTQNDVTVTDSLAHANDATAEDTLTDAVEDVAEDVHAVQLEVNACRTGADVTVALTVSARTQEVSARHAQKVTRKRLPSRT